MNSKKTKELRKIYDEKGLEFHLSFKKYKRIYSANIAKGNNALAIIKGRTHGVA